MSDSLQARALAWLPANTRVSFAKAAKIGLRTLLTAGARHAVRCDAEVAIQVATLRRVLPLSGLTSSAAMRFLTGQEAGGPTLWEPGRNLLVDRARVLRFVDLYARRRLGLAHNALSHHLTDPSRTARLAYIVIRRTLRTDELGGLWGSCGMFLLAVACAGMTLPQRCELNCFRLCAPTRMRCPAHSRGKGDAGASPARRRVRAAGRQMGFDWANIDVEGPIPGGSDRMGDVLAAALWPANSKEAEHWKSEVRQAIIQSPLTQARLGIDISKLDRRRACEHLRQAIDPWEFGVSSWANKVLVAEATFAIEASRPRRVRQATLDRVVTAQTLLSQGLSRKAIAERLGMKPATLDRVLSRYADLRAPKID